MMYVAFVFVLGCGAVLSATATTAPLRSSECTIEKGCPRSAMVWASGSFTDPQLLTPAVFRQASNLELKFSLCCGYKFHGQMLRDQELWDGFLQELLSATPLRMLSLQAKNKLFPRELASLHDTVQFLRTMDVSYVPTAQDAAFGNDGDGDVLVLLAQSLGDDVELLKHQLSFIAPNLFAEKKSHTTTSVVAEGDSFVSASLKISNTVLKCKCPHNLLVMPAIEIYPEFVPEVSIVSGPRCGTLKAMMKASDGTSSREAPTGFVELLESTTREDSEGSLFFSLVSFGTSVSVPSFTALEWTVRPLLGGNIESQQTFYTTVPYALPHLSTEPQRPGSVQSFSNVTVLPNVRYLIELTLRRERAMTTSRAEFVLRVPLNPLLVSTGDLSRVLMDSPHFGDRRQVSATASSAAMIQHAIETTYFTAFWEHTSNILVFPHGDEVDDGPLAVHTSQIPVTLQLHSDADGGKNVTRVETTLLLGLGKNVISLVARDVDGMCPPTVVQVQVIDTLRAQMLQPTPPRHVACSENVSLVARNAQQVFSGLLQKYPSYFSESQMGTLVSSWFCRQTQPIDGPACSFEPADLGQRRTTLVINRKSVRLVQWQLIVPVLKSAFEANPDHFDIQRVTFSNQITPGMTIRSDRVVVYRRLSSIPQKISTVINTRQTLFELRAPEEAEGGRWEVRQPFREVHVDTKKKSITISCEGLTDFTAHIIKPVAVRFLAADRGEEISSGAEEGDENTTTSRQIRVQCPETPVEYEITVIPEAPPTVFPDKEDVYTEQPCIKISPPRAPFRDESISWSFPLERDETCNSLTQQAASSSSVTVCGVMEGSSCPVVWETKNKAGTSSKAYLIHRCFSAPNVLLKTTGPSARNIEPIILGDSMSGPGGVVLPVAMSDKVMIGFDLPNYSIGSGREDLFHATLRIGSQAGGPELDKDASLAFSLPRHDELSDEMAAPNGDVAELTVREATRIVIFSRLASRVLSLHNARLGPATTLVNFTVERTSPSAEPVTTKGKRGVALQLVDEFKKRSLCQPITGAWRMLSVVPLATVHQHVRETLSSSKPHHVAYAMHVCNSTFRYYVHPALHRDFGFDFTWQCPTDSMIVAEKRSPTQSVLSLPLGAQGECSLTASNSVTDTSLATTLLVKRVSPALVDVVFEIISPNELKRYDDSKLKSAHASRAASARGSKQQQRAAVANLPQPSTSTLYKRIVGRSATIRAINVVADQASWSIESFVFHQQPASRQPLQIPTFEPVMDADQEWRERRQFGEKEQQRAIAASTELEAPSAVISLTSIAVSGIYTIRVDQADPQHPKECPMLSHTFMVYTYFAQVASKEIDVCGSSALLQAVALPAELVHEFVGQWEVVSVQVSPTQVLYSGMDFQRIRFEHGSNRPRTEAIGLDFGIYTFRWAIYTNSAVNPSGRVLVDFATVKVNVLTENLRSERLVTLSNRADIPMTSSTVDFTVPEEFRLSEGYLARKLTLSRHTVNNSDATFIRAENIPIGSVKLEYVLKMSDKLSQWGDLFANITRCKPQKRLFDLTRVSAFLLANTSMQHECDAYRTRANITLCIHASASSADGRDRRTIAQEENDAVRLVSPDAIETIIKSAADQQHRTSCVTAPWWATSAANWTYTVNYEDNRCVLIEVVANRFLTFEEASQPLFVGRRQSFCSPSRSVSGGGGGYSSSPSDDTSAAFITSRILHSVNVHHEPRGGDDHLDKPDSQQPSRGVVAQHFIPIFESSVNMVPRASTRIAAMRGLDKLDDVGETETNIASGNSAEIVLRLDVADRERVLLPQEPNLGGFYTPPADVPFAQEPTLLWKCINGTLLGADLISYFEELGKKDPAGKDNVAMTTPDGDTTTSSFWDEYVAAVQHERVWCDVVFQDLQHLIPTKDTAFGEDRQTDEQKKSKKAVDSGDAHAHSIKALKERRRRLRVPLNQRTVSLRMLEEQLASIAVHHTWTRDGIDVTGLSQEIRDALEQRKIKRWMIPEIEKARRHLGPLDASFQAIDKQLATSGISSDEASSSNWIKSDEERVARYTRAIKAYEATTGEPVAAISIRLPAYPKFTTPRLAAIRMRLPKSVICGLRPDDAQHKKIDDDDKQAATVASRRLYIKDDPPVAALSDPPFIKQCEVEAEMPVLRFTVSGTRFDQRRLPLSSHPPSSSSSLSMGDAVVSFTEIFPTVTRRMEDEEAGVGLTKCIELFSAAAILRLNATTTKEMELRLPPCPLFKMVSQKDYNEEEESDEVLNKMRVPRIIRITFHQAIVRDSFTDDGDDQREKEAVGEFFDSAGDTAWSGIGWKGHVVGRNLMIDVLIRPTLARVYLRTLRQRLTVAPLAPEGSSSSSSAPLLLCEGDLKQHGMELVVELLGDTWTSQIGTPVTADGSTSSSSSVKKQPIEWGSHNTAMRNGFSIVEHHGLDSTSHVLLTGRGMYRSHFLQYLHDEIYADERLAHTTQFVRRYNDTLVGIAIPPRPAATTRRSIHDEDDIVPRISSFSAVEEIMFAVPGIATRCPGCLLADATFFIAGDFTGVWQISRDDQAAQPRPAVPLVVPSSRHLTAPLIINFASSKTLPRNWLYTLLCPTTALQNMLRVQERLHGQDPFFQFEVMTELQKDLTGEDTPASQRRTVLFHSSVVTLQHVVRTAQATASGLANSASPTHIIFRTNESSLTAGYQLLASDFTTRFDKRHLVPQFDYFQDFAYSDGLWAVNATCVLRLCHYSSSLRCTAVLVKPALVFVEDVDASLAAKSSQSSSFFFPNAVLNALFPSQPQNQRSTGNQRHYPRPRNASWTRLALLALHHCGTAFLVVVLLRQRLRANRNIHTAVGIGSLMLVAGLYLMFERMWFIMWLALWLGSIVTVPSATCALLFVAHFVWLLSAAPQTRDVWGF